MPLTTEQIEKLHAAINLAKEPGGCKYVVGGAPCCVVAQLARLEGVSLETLKVWNEMHPSNFTSDQVTYLEILSRGDGEAKRLRDIYGARLLADLQEIWDLYESAHEATTRAKMHELVAINSPHN